MGLDPSKDNISEITNSDIVEIIEHEYEFHLQSEEELQEEIELCYRLCICTDME
jgi:hypothetical protein